MVGRGSEAAVETAEQTDPPRADVATVRRAPPPAGRSAIAAVPVSFPSSSPFVLRDVQAGGRRTPPVKVGAMLRLPPGVERDERRPAVVILHGLGGILAERETSYGADLARQGYVTLVVDSFGCRGAGDMNHTRRALRVTESMILADAYAALRFLARHPTVDPDRVAVMGFSYGGMVSVFAAYEQVRQYLAPEGRRFAAHVSFYGCSTARFARAETTGAPVAMLLGALDANVPVARSILIKDDLERGGSPVTFQVYADTYHQWDGPDVTPRRVNFSLAPCDFLVEPDGRIRDRRTGLTMRGPVSRCAILAVNVSRSGYVIQQDRKVKRRSDEDLARFLEATLRP